MKKVTKKVKSTNEKWNEIKAKFTKVFMIKVVVSFILLGMTFYFINLWFNYKLLAVLFMWTWANNVFVVKD